MHETFETRLPELNDLLGGGFLRGEGTLIGYEERGLVGRIFLNLGIGVADSMLSSVVVPPRTVSIGDIEMYFDRLDISLGSLLDHDQLFVLDTAGTWPDRRNVFHVDSLDAIQERTETALQRSNARGTAHMVTLDSVVATLGADDARRLRRWHTTAFRGKRDLLIEGFHSPGLSDDLVEFYSEQDRQVLQLTRTDGELALRLEAAPDGAVGETRKVRYLDERPFVELS